MSFHPITSDLSYSKILFILFHLCKLTLNIPYLHIRQDKGGKEKNQTLWSSLYERMQNICNSLTNLSQFSYSYPSAENFRITRQSLIILISKGSILNQPQCFHEDIFARFEFQTNNNDYTTVWSHYIVYSKFIDISH